MKPNRACRRLFAVAALLCSSYLAAAPYPTEDQLRSAIGTGAGILRSQGIALEALDARKEGLNLSLLAAGLNLETGTCLVFYNTRPAAALSRFFDELEERDMPTWLNAIAVHEATHCVEQREAYLRQRFEKVLPPRFEHQGMTVQGYLSVVKSGAVETWGEALADIASVLYLKEAVPQRWTYFAEGIATLRHDLAARSPEHDTSPWLRRVIAEESGTGPNPNIFETAFELRQRFLPR
ncbi:MAG TPA: hypothetical protein VFF03_17875 [Rhodocyclaceae bacterium]|nr:hypothetical protein [Rhodocyclaceae bacterium]